MLNEQLDIEQELVAPQLIRGPSAEIQHIPLLPAADHIVAPQEMIEAAQ
jgi:hypothetical protein